MARYTIRWVTYAEQQRDSLPAEGRRELDALLDRLADDPRRHGTYDKRTERRTVPDDIPRRHAARLDVAG